MDDPFLTEPSNTIPGHLEAMGMRNTLGRIFRNYVTAVRFVEFRAVQDRGAGRLPGHQFASGNHTNDLVPLWALGAGSTLWGRAPAASLDQREHPLVQIPRTHVRPSSTWKRFPGELSIAVRRGQQEQQIAENSGTNSSELTFLDHPYGRLRRTFAEFFRSFLRFLCTTPSA